jgi:hypothetical protein
LIFKVDKENIKAVSIQLSAVFAGAGCFHLLSSVVIFGMLANSPWLDIVNFQSNK